MFRLVTLRGVIVEGIEELLSKGPLTFNICVPPGIDRERVPSYTAESI